MNGFPQDVEVWSRDGDVKKLADRPSREGTTLTGVEAGPRSYQWRADQPATVLWVEALDGGDNRDKVPFRDKVVSLAAPFSAQPTEIDENRVAIRRHLVHRHRHRAAERERSRVAADAHLADGAGRGAAQSVGPQAGRRVRRSGQSGDPSRYRYGGPWRRRRTRRTRGRTDHAERRLHFRHRSGCVTGRRPSVPRQVEHQDAEDRARLPVIV